MSDVTSGVLKGKGGLFGFDVSIPFILLHTVTSRNAESGGILYNETLSDAELLFNTPNSCDQYEVSATVMRETATKY